jgi:hypothetical protein
MQTFQQHFDAEDHFLSFDLGLSSALVTLGYQLVSIDKQNRAKAQFVFRRKSTLDRDIQRYWDDTLQLPVRSMFDNLKMLKNRIHSD